MGLFDRLLKRGDRVATEEVFEATCLHSAIVPRWDRLDDMGKEELISSYHCDACGQDFTREEGQRILAEEKRRLQEQL